MFINIWHTQCHMMKHVVWLPYTRIVYILYHLILVTDCSLQSQGKSLILVWWCDSIMLSRGRPQGHSVECSWCILLCHSKHWFTLLYVLYSRLTVSRWAVVSGYWWKSSHVTLNTPSYKKKLSNSNVCFPLFTQ